ncbi:MAG: metabolite traffic protein EboE [Fibrobacteria bacterium]|nr:metabolite traffic protein EboE [Fibrobacteria bacterium]
MKLPNQSHLTYCLNIHKGENWEENLSAITSYAKEVKQRVSPSGPFGLGLRLSNLAAGQLSESKTLDAFKTVLSQNNMYVFTINGFPYGTFHGTPVKENVYQPDWRTEERRDYTIQLANILAALIPPDTIGTISTVPCSYKTWIKRKNDVQCMVEKLMDCVSHLVGLYEEKGKTINIGLEPEPDCFLETTDEVIDFFEQQLFDYGVNYLAEKLACNTAEAANAITRHLGVCFDTCHIALQFEDITDSLKRLQNHNITISKIQVSAALKTIISDNTVTALKPFCDPVYFHQVKIKDAGGILASYTDLPISLNQISSGDYGKKLRAHFHVPLYYSGGVEIKSTSAELTSDFFKQAISCGANHFEIETYTFDVLPENLRVIGVVESVVKEYEWVMDKIAP